MEKEGILESGEGALVIDGEWYHFLPGEFKINEMEYAEDADLPTKVPIEWRITGGRDERGDPLLDLKVNSTKKLSWVGLLGKENEFITNYVLRAHGTWKGKRIEGKGTLENQMHRMID